MSLLSTEHWLHLHGQPTCQGQIKTQPQDFVVEEILGYQPSGEGEHIYLWVEKCGLNTAYVAEQIAQFCQLPLRAVTYAGRKDKHAVTRQWFGVHAPGKIEFDWSGLQLEGLSIKQAIRHHKKLKVGNLQGNAFTLNIRQLTTTDGLAERIAQVAAEGVPNYFGSQRFGDTRYDARGGNLVLAAKMLEGEVVRNRNKRSMAISALRAWLFNQFVHQRIAQNCFNQPLNGDICILAGSNSFFCAQPPDESIRKRLAEGDILLSAPMWGAGALDSRADAQQFEQQLAGANQAVCDTLAQLGLEQQRRAIKLLPKDLQWHLQANTLNIKFSLPAGCFATSVIREIVSTSE